MISFVDMGIEKEEVSCNLRPAFRHLVPFPDIEEVLLRFSIDLKSFEDLVSVNQI